MISRTSLCDPPRAAAIPGRLRAGVLVASSLLFVSLSLRADTPGANAAAGSRVNINQASVEQISYLPRIGAKVAARVVDYRKTHGQFARAEDLMEVKGIGEKLFLTLKPYIAVSGPTTLAAKVRLGASSSRRREAASPAGEKPPPKSAPASVPAGKGR
jgi:competence ComEA-like helix-hairpin-helix protein